MNHIILQRISQKQYMKYISILSAAGAYQITYETWKEAKQHGVANDFTPASQDMIARWLIETKGQLKNVEDENLAEAISKLRGIWVSLPGGSQSHMSMEEAQTRFNYYLENKH